MSNIYQEFGVNGGDSREIMNARKNAGLAFTESRLLGMNKDSHGLAFAESKLLGMNKDSQKIRKPASAPPPPPYGGRKPVIIHTYSPKVIQTEAHNFMQLVQKLTGWDEEHKQKKRKQKSKNKKRDSNAQNSETHLSVSLPSPAAEDLSSAKRSGCGRRVTETNSVTNASSADNNHNNCLELYSRQQMSSRDNLPVSQNCFQEISSTTASAAYSTGMAENSYAASSSCGLLSNMVVDLPHLFHIAPNYASSQSLRLPCKQTPSPPPDADAHNFNVNPCQEQVRYVENLPSSSPATLGDGLYNISELLPQIFAKDFEFQHLL